MILPNAEEARVDRQNVVEYLLNVDHSDAWGKAQVFRKCGFRPSKWEEFARVLRDHASQNHVTDTNSSPFGTKYVVEGSILTPTGDELPLRTVWIIEPDAVRPRLITAYPTDAPETDDPRT